MKLMKCRGFTLIEVMVVCVMIGILAAIALPSYNSYVRETRRLDAKNALIALQFAQEKYRGNNPTYSLVLSDLGLTGLSAQQYYTLAITDATGTGYTATATVNSASAQASDTGCPALSVTETGFIADATAACWKLK